MAATHSRTWTGAFVLNTREVGSTLGVNRAFWPTFNVRISFQPRQTRTGGCSVSFATLGINPAWSWLAGVDNVGPVGGG